MTASSWAALHDVAETTQLLMSGTAIDSVMGKIPRGHNNVPTLQAVEINLGPVPLPPATSSLDNCLKRR
ncbi:MAG: hypothetical protein R8K48_06640 [Gallionella sp.]